jgi:hypothetical protein
MTVTPEALAFRAIVARNVAHRHRAVAAHAARLHAPPPITPPSSRAAPAPTRSPMPPARHPQAEAARLAKLAARIEHLEREVRPRVATFEERLRSLEHDAREAGDERKLRELAELRRQHEAVQRGEPAPAPAPGSDAAAIARAMPLPSTRVSATGVVRSRDGRSITLGAIVEESRSPEERQRERDAIRRATESGERSIPGAPTTVVARAPGDTRSPEERQRDALAMRIALGSSSIEHTGTARTRNGIALGVPTDTKNR